MRTPAQSLLSARSPAAPVWREVRETVALGVPLILAQIGQIAINTTDVLMVGRLGERALAAIALGNSLNEIKCLMMIWIRVMEILGILEIIEVIAITYSSTQENYHFFPEFPVTRTHDACPQPAYWGISLSV